VCSDCRVSHTLKPQPPDTELLAEGFSPSLSLSLSPLSLSRPLGVSCAGPWQRPYTVQPPPPLQTDCFWRRSECLCLFMQTLFQLLFFLFLSTESCFSLPPFLARPWQAYFLHRVCVCVCASLCVSVSEHFSGVEAAFMSVPSVENGSPAREGRPLAPHSGFFFPKKSLHLMSDLLLSVHEATQREHLIPAGAAVSSVYRRVADIVWSHWGPNKGKSHLMNGAVCRRLSAVTRRRLPPPSFFGNVKT